MLIAEIFHSIQGEGRLAGVPSVFVRTSGCNLRCVWCDTPYASWEPEGREMAVTEILEAVEAAGSRHVVVTGGEPMIARGMAELLERLSARGHHVTVETAGTVEPRGVPCDLASLSPKLAHSTPTEEAAGAWAARHEARRLRPDILRQWIRGYDHQLKFVVAEAGDLEEIRRLLDELGGEVLPERVLLMPEGVCPEVLRERALWLVEICRRTGYRYCPRLHVDLFGHVRGT